MVVPQKKVKFGSNQVQTQLAQSVSNFCGICVNKILQVVFSPYSHAQIPEIHCDNVLPHVSFLFLRFTVKKVCTACSRTSYKIILLTKLNKIKYLHNDTSETEVNIITSVNNASEKF
jgi:hypothetical protein